MGIVYYDVMFVISLVLLLAYAFMWQKHFDVNLTMIFVLVPLANLGYCWMARAESIREALLANKAIYISGCFLPLFVSLAIFGLCKIKINSFIRAILFLTSLVSYASVLTIGYNRWFYKSVSRDLTNGYVVLQKEYGPMHTVYMIFIVIYFLMGVAALTYSYFKRKDISHNLIALLFLPEMISVVTYFGLRYLYIDGTKVEMLPVTYNAALFVFIMIVYRLTLYDVTDSAIDSIVEKGNTGFASFDFKYRFLGSDEPALEMLPFLGDLKVDTAIKEECVISWLKDFREDPRKDRVHYRVDDKICLIAINYLVSGRRKVGYQLLITDDTKDQKYMEMLKDFNLQLEDKVREKTAHIEEMHNNLIISMAMMVESRDNSTGGHIKRTSEGVRILIEEMKKGGYEGLSESFCRNIIKAAPMHDLGKIAVKDAILTFEGRYNKEQREEMQKHAAEGARIVHEILKSTDDYEFHIIAENVAHYHHERWDGSGYPEGLKGEQIPLEARIMAVADVYDALVSKRCYKDSYSFERADSIIMDGFGTQFDASLKPYYVAARPLLEEYYRGINQD
ncbi:MAG: HD domain-containing protein [Clostridiales bacterium]|nr:HD domain-containing protein [Clostridiales bacterium]